MIYLKKLDIAEYLMYQGYCVMLSKIAGKVHM